MSKKYKQEWFARWFNKHYQILYPHRDKEQAAQQVELVLKEFGLLELSGGNKILDLACGDGFYSRTEFEEPNR